MNLYLLYEMINTLIISYIMADFVIGLIVIFIRILGFNVIIFAEIREKTNYIFITFV